MRRVSDLQMLSFAVVLCIVVGVFGQKLAPITKPPTLPTVTRLPSTLPTRPPTLPPPPGSLTDDEGNVYKVEVTGAGTMLYDSSGNLLSTILNKDGWVVMVYPDGNCTIVDHNAVDGDCFVEVPYNGVPLPANIQASCKRIVKHVKVPCEEEQKPEELVKRQIGDIAPAPILPVRPRWSRCCRWRRVVWWPCGRPVCLANNSLRRCVSWGCGLWQWHWRWVRICVEGFEWPFWG